MRGLTWLAAPAVLLAVVLPTSGPMPPSDCPTVVRAADPVPALMIKIARREGYYRPGSLPRRYNNPGALAYARQRFARRGSTGEDGRTPFAVFDSPEHGWEALAADLRKKLAKGVPLTRGWAYAGGL